jgi:hypothetical protein
MSPCAGTLDLALGLMVIGFVFAYELVVDSLDAFGCCPVPSTTPLSVSLTLFMTQMKPWSFVEFNHGWENFFESSCLNALRSKGFSLLLICATNAPLMMTLWLT